MRSFVLKAAKTLTPAMLDAPSKEDLKSRELIIQTDIGSICGSDIPRWDGSEWFHFPGRPGFPMHECIGTVIASRAENFQRGDRVVAMPAGDAGLAEYFITSDLECARVPIGLESSLAVLAQPLSTVLWALDRLESVAGLRVLLIGYGAMGHLAGWMLNARGADVTAVDPVGDREASVWGISRIYKVRSDELSIDDVGEVDLTVELVGHQSRTMLDAIRLTRRRGTILSFGVPAPGMALPLEQIFRQNLTIVTSVTPPWSSYLPVALEKLAAERLLMSRLVSHSFTMSEAPDAYLTYADRQMQPSRLKVQVNISER
jgi:L-iditol 2-dehydrogenase